MAITVNAPAELPDRFIDSNDHVSKGQSNVKYSVANIPGVRYIWSCSDNGAIIKGSSNSVHVDYSENASSCTINVRTENDCGSSEIRSINIRVDNNHNKSAQIPGGILSDSQLANNELKVYPNPTTGPVTFEFRVNQSSNATLDLSTITGQGVARIFNGNVEAGISQTAKFDQTLSPGVYICTLRWNDQMITQKLILN